MRRGGAEVLREGVGGRPEEGGQEEGAPPVSFAIDFCVGLVWILVLALVWVVVWFGLRLDLGLPAWRAQLLFF